jgi:hypothetical protein
MPELGIVKPEILHFVQDDNGAFRMTVLELR